MEKLRLAGQTGLRRAYLLHTQHDRVLRSSSASLVSQMMETDFLEVISYAFQAQSLILWSLVELLFCIPIFRATTSYLKASSGGTHLSAASYGHCHEKKNTQHLRLLLIHTGIRPTPTLVTWVKRTRHRNAQHAWALANFSKTVIYIVRYRTVSRN